jgi:hypothetical protein
MQKAAAIKTVSWISRSVAPSARAASMSELGDALAIDRNLAGNEQERAKLRLDPCEIEVFRDLSIPPPVVTAATAVAGRCLVDTSEMAAGKRRRWCLRWRRRLVRAFSHGSSLAHNGSRRPNKRTRHSDYRGFFYGRNRARSSEPSLSRWLLDPDTGPILP